jgi:hypothetical protein
MVTDFKTTDKDSDFFDTMLAHFGQTINLAQIKFLSKIFKSLKSSGFNVEDTHLADIQRIERLFAVFTIAFLWAYLVGIFKDQFIKPIRTLNNGRKAFSFFKYGLDTISSTLLNLDRQTDIDIFKILSCT